MDSNPMMVDAGLPRLLVQKLAEALQAHYVFPEAAGAISAGLERHLAAGDYADLAEAELLALALTLHMQEVSHDEHLWVRYHPEPLPEAAEALRQSPAWQAARRAEAALDNFGFHKVERLPGNVGYLDLRYLHRPAWGGETAIATMNWLAHAGALIIDLRKCDGGYPAMIALLLSYLFGEEPVLLSSIYWRDDDQTQQYWSWPYVPGRRFGDKPVYVLTSRATFSAGEEFASILQTRRRAVVIGDKTDGGAHPGAAYRLHPHFEAFIPVGRAINPVTGQDLEGVGVSPDIAVPQEQALLAAYHKALRGMVETLSASPTEASQACRREAEQALKEQAARHKICAQCGYPNPLYLAKCKNCDAALAA